jgi:prepilin-type N-terminal cleavage/methylation domain-containing protein
MHISRGKSRRKSAFTLVELLVVIGIIAILIAILLPALSKARKQSATAKCISNLRQLMMATMMYVNDNQGFLPYTGLDDGPGKPTYGQYYANWLYNPYPPPAGSPPGTGTVSSGFTSDDVKSGALYDYLNNPQVYRCPLDANPPFFSNDGSNTPLFNALTSYVMNSSLCNFEWDNPKGGTITSPPKAYHTHPLHKLNEFHPANVAFWDYPAGGSLDNSGNQYYVHLSAPSSLGKDRPCVSGRHAGPINHVAGGFLNQMPGGLPTVFIDGHAELWPLYLFQQNMVPKGLPAGSSAIWCCPNAPQGGYDDGNYTMTDIYSQN